MPEFTHLLSGEDRLQTRQGGSKPDPAWGEEGWVGREAMGWLLLSCTPSFRLPTPQGELRVGGPGGGVHSSLGAMAVEP